MTALCNIKRRVGILACVILVGCITAAAQAAISITAPIGTQPGSHAAWTFVGASDGNVWLNTSFGGSWHWQNLAPLNVSFGVGVTAPGGNPAAYAVGTDGNLYIIHQVGSSWSTQNIGTPPGVALRTPVGVISNTSNQPFVFLIGSDGNLWLAHNAGSWTWRNLETPSGISLAKAVGAVNIPGSYPQIFIIGGDGNLWVSQWNGSSYPWTLLGHPPGLQITAGMWAWEQSNLPYGFVVAPSGGGSSVWYAHQLSSGGAWQWTHMTNNYGVLMPVGMPLNDTYACTLVSDSELSENALGSGFGPFINLPPPYTAQASVGVSDFGLGPYIFLINTNGDLEVVYGLGSGNILDLGRPQ